MALGRRYMVGATSMAEGTFSSISHQERGAGGGGSPTDITPLVQAIHHMHRDLFKALVGLCERPVIVNVAAPEVTVEAVVVPAPKVIVEAVVVPAPVVNVAAPILPEPVVNVTVPPASTEIKVHPCLDVSEMADRQVIVNHTTMPDQRYPLAFWLLFAISSTLLATDILVRIFHH